MMSFCVRKRNWSYNVFCVVFVFGPLPKESGTLGHLNPFEIEQEIVFGRKQSLLAFSTGLLDIIKERNFEVRSNVVEAHPPKLWA